MHIQKVRTGRAGLFIAAAAAAAIQSPSAMAEDALQITGFASVVAGKVLSGSRNEPLYAYDCPCFIGDFSRGALYRTGWQMKQETRLGLQATYNFSPKFTATTQVVGRGADGIKADLEWAYLTYEADDHWTFQVGRKRLPLYYFSDFQDVGYAYTWVRPPTDLYGWEVVNYNGINATYRTYLGNWAAKANVFFGREDSKNNLMQRIYYATPQDVTWKSIAGLDVVMTRGPWTTRASLIKTKVQQWDRDTGARVTPVPDSTKNAEPQTIYGLSGNLDLNNWLVRTEYSIFDRSAYSYKSRAWMVGVGYRWADLTAMVTKTRYSERNSFSPNGQQNEGNLSITLRYELANATALKVQIDRYSDKSGPDLPFVGSSSLLSFAIDTVF